MLFGRRIQWLPAHPFNAFVAVRQNPLCVLSEAGVAQGAKDIEFFGVGARAERSSRAAKLNRVSM